MSFIDLELMGIQSPDIMAQCVETKQMLLASNRKVDWLMVLYSPVSSLNALEYRISQKLPGRQQQGRRGDSFCKNDLFSGVRQVFFVGRAITSGTSNPKVRMVRFVGLPFVFTSDGGRRTDVGKLGMIRFGKMTGFSEVQ